MGLVSCLKIIVSKRKTKDCEKSNILISCTSYDFINWQSYYWRILKQQKSIHFQMLAFESSISTLWNHEKFMIIEFSNEQSGGKGRTMNFRVRPNQVPSRLVRHWPCQFQRMTSLSGFWLTIWNLGIRGLSQHNGQRSQLEIGWKAHSPAPDTQGFLPLTPLMWIPTHPCPGMYR